jgi:hypothetical protein
LVNFVQIESSQRHDRDFAAAELKCPECSILLRLAAHARANFPHRRVVPEKIMAKPKNDKPKEYARYAARCLDMTTTKTSREDREVLREMTAEWLKLVDWVLHPSKPMK